MSTTRTVRGIQGMLVLATLIGMTTLSFADRELEQAVDAASCLNGELSNTNGANCAEKNEAQSSKPRAKESMTCQCTLATGGGKDSITLKYPLNKKWRKSDEGQYCGEKGAICSRDCIGWENDQAARDQREPRQFMGGSCI